MENKGTAASGVVALHKSGTGKSKKGKKKKSLKPQPHAVLMLVVKHSQMLDKLYGPPVTSVDKDGKIIRRRTGASKDIPFGFPDIFKGTQAPVFRLRIANIQISTTASGAYATVQGITGAALLNITDIANMWDEYRVLRGEIEYVPTWMPATNSIAMYHTVAVIDYVNNATLASLDAALVHDTAKKFYMGIVPAQRNADDPRWPLVFEKLPDQDWLATSNITQAFCYWKPFSNIAQQVSTITGIGYLTGYVDIQVRGQAA